MLGRSRKLLTRGRDGTWTLHLGADERQLLGSLAGELDAMLEARPDDPSLRRLHPTAYIEDEEHEAAWQLLIGEELRTTRRAQLDVLRAAAERTKLDDDEVQGWMQALNALRLVLGTRLDVSEDEVRSAGRRRSERCRRTRSTSCSATCSIGRWRPCRLADSLAADAGLVHQPVERRGSRRRSCPP